MVHLVDNIFWHLGFKSAQHAEKVMSQIIDYCDYCNYCDYFQVRVDNGVLDSVWVNKRASIAKEIRDLGAGYRQILRDGWVQWSTTSRRKMLLADRGRVLGGSKPLWEARLLWMMKLRFCCLQAAICPVERLPSPRCATVPYEGFWKWSIPTNLLLARKSNNNQIITNNYHQIIIK